jgi:RNA polymerase sigma factor (sigma-70 family)
VSEDGFALFFRERYHKTVLLLMTMGASRADAEDAVQEAMTAAWRQWEEIREPAAWLRIAALRAFWKHNRQQVPTALLQEITQRPAADDPDLAVFADEQRWVLALLRALAPEQRTAAALFYDGLTVCEIAALTSKPTATVRSHLRHARRRLKEMIMPDRLPTVGTSP